MDAPEEGNMDEPVKRKKTPPCMANSMAAEIFRGMREFYGDPKNMANFLEWKKTKEEVNGAAYAPVTV